MKTKIIVTIVGVLLILGVFIASAYLWFDGTPLLEGYNTGDDSYKSFSYPVAQTFYLDSTATMTSLKLKMFRIDNPGQIVITIEETENGDPMDNGETFSVGAFDGNTLTTDVNGEWVEIDMQDVSLNGDQVYAIVVDAPESELPNVVCWRGDRLEGYSKGSSYTSYGDIWNELHLDFMFEIWGS